MENIYKIRSNPIRDYMISQRLLNTTSISFKVYLQFFQICYELLQLVYVFKYS